MNPKKSRTIPFPRLDTLFLRWLGDKENRSTILGDTLEEFEMIRKENGQKKAAVWLAGQILISIPATMKRCLFWRTMMVRNYFTTARRHLARHKGYSWVNIGGLALGMACAWILFFYVRFESSFDTYHANADWIYRVVLDIRTNTSHRSFSLISATAGPALKERFPQVETFTRILEMSDPLIRRGEKIFYESGYYTADNDLFDIFSIRFLQGDKASALTRPHTIVLSRSIADKYFGDENPIGQTITINGVSHEVTGVIEDAPRNTHFQYTMIKSLRQYDAEYFMENWHGTEFWTYIRVKPGTNIQEFSDSIRDLADSYVGETLRSWGEMYVYTLQSIRDIHLRSHLSYEMNPPGNPQLMTILIFVGLLILGIAWMNFVNLTTARAAERFLEVGMRKTLGARPFSIVRQFIGETLLQGGISLAISLCLVAASLPTLNRLAGSSLRFQDMLKGSFFFVVLGFLILIAAGAGFYPAWVLSRLNPARILKANSGFTGKRFLRRILVVGQFAISATLVICTLLIQKQVRYMKNQNLGFEKDQKLIIPVRGGIRLDEHYRTLKTLFLAIPEATQFTASAHVPGRGVSNFAAEIIGENDNKNQSMYHFFFDPDFIPTYQIKMAAGRAFDWEMETDVLGAMVLNEAAVKAFGWNRPEEALGKIVKSGMGGVQLPVIGVIEDFHYKGLQSAVEPLIMVWFPPSFRYITLILNGDVLGAVEQVRSIWEKCFPQQPFEFFFLEPDFNRQYQMEERTSRLFHLFSGLGLAIGCLGLLGLAAYTAQQKTREIGIRKVLGASMGRVVLTLTADFTCWVLLANILAWPMAYWICGQWLRQFSQRTPVDLMPFVLSLIFTLGLAWLTVGFIATRAAGVNPAKALKYE